jgi:hypothetical protein
MKTIKNILFLVVTLTLLPSINFAQRQQVEIKPTVEKWAKFTCRGPVTPKGKTPIVYKDIVSAHFRVGGDGFPTATMLYDQNYLQLQNVTDLCSERRWQQVDLTGWTGNAGHTTFLDWETDHLYERYTISAVEFDPKFTRRSLGMPCDKSVACLGRGLRCNTVINTCESSDTTVILEPALDTRN